jgi:hypothetical protein
MIPNLVIPLVLKFIKLDLEFYGTLHGTEEDFKVFLHFQL